MDLLSLCIKKGKRTPVLQLARSRSSKQKETEIYVKKVGCKTETSSQN